MVYKDKEYFDKMEDYNYEMLTYFNNDQHIFAELDRTKYMHCIDASGTSKGGCKAYIETKARTGITSGYDDIFIESKKVAYLTLSYIVDGYIPLYINYMDYADGFDYTLDLLPHTIMVWRLDKLNKWDYIPYIPTKSGGYKTVQVQERFCLFKSDATVYRLNPGNKTYRMETTDGIRCN